MPPSMYTARVRVHWWPCLHLKTCLYIRPYRHTRAVTPALSLRESSPRSGSHRPCRGRTQRGRRREAIARSPSRPLRQVEGQPLTVHRCERVVLTVYFHRSGPAPGELAELISIRRRRSGFGLGEGAREKGRRPTRTKQIFKKPRNKHIKTKQKKKP